jgi:hypothetical protein
VISPRNERQQRLPLHDRPGEPKQLEQGRQDVGQPDGSLHDAWRDARRDDDQRDAEHLDVQRDPMETLHWPSTPKA